MIVFPPPWLVDTRKHRGAKFNPVETSLLMVKDEGSRSRDEVEAQAGLALFPGGYIEAVAKRAD
jgi:hypothetical protein